MHPAGSRVRTTVTPGGGRERTSTTLSSGRSRAATTVSLPARPSRPAAARRPGGPVIRAARTCRPGRPAPPPVTAGPPPRTGAARLDPSVVHPLAAEASSVSTRPHPGHRGRVPVDRRVAGDAPRRRAPGRRQGGRRAARPVALATGGCAASPARTRPWRTAHAVPAPQVQQGSDDRQLRRSSLHHEGERQCRRAPPPAQVPPRQAQRLTTPPSAPSTSRFPMRP